MSHARIEEVSDSDLSDPSEGDIDDFAESDILLARSSSSSKPTNTNTNTTMIHPSQHPQTAHIKPDDIKDYQMLYPIYFDARRTRSSGRRVPSSLAVANPLARTVASACAALRLAPVLEAHRTHPRDWANPGRVRVRLRDAAPAVKNKHHLYVLVARYLREHPTTEDSDALRRAGNVAGMFPPAAADDNDEGGGGSSSSSNKWPRPAVPRGWENKMGDLLPAYSAAMTGGGVSENAFKEMMKEMQGAGGPGGGMPGMPGGITPDMMSMLGGMGGGLGGMLGGGGGAAGSEAGGSGGGGGKKGKKGKR